MKLKLKTDFRDYYDHWFDRDGLVLERMGRTDMDREQQFAHLQNTLGLSTPECGPAKFAIGPNDDREWVAHLDPFAHRGEGKVVLRGQAIRAQHSDETFVVRYVAASRGASLRHLQIGDQAWLLNYKSSDDWRSNCGDVTVFVDGLMSRAHPMTAAPWPLFAVDFVLDEGGDPLAIDLNTSPGMTGTGMEEILKPRDVVDLLKAWHERRAVGAGTVGK